MVLRFFFYLKLTCNYFSALTAPSSLVGRGGPQDRPPGEDWKAPDSGSRLHCWWGTRLQLGQGARASAR